MLKRINSALQDYYAAGIVGALALGFVGGLSISDQATIRDYQALTGSLIALTAALMAVAVNRRNKKEQDFREHLKNVEQIRLATLVAVFGRDFLEDFTESDSCHVRCSNYDVVATFAQPYAGSEFRKDTWVVADAIAFESCRAGEGDQAMIDRLYRLNRWCSNCIERGYFCRYDNKLKRPLTNHLEKPIDDK